MNYSLFSPLAQSSPFNRLPGLSGQIVRDLTSSGGVSPEIVVAEWLPVMSLLTQGMAYVALPNGLQMPIGVNVYLSAPSQSGKLSVSKILMRPIEQHLAMRSSANGASLLDHFFIEGDATGSAIVRSLHECPVAGLFTDKPGQLKKLLKDDHTLAKIFDNTSHLMVRTAGKCIELKAPCLTMFLTEELEAFDATMLLGACKSGAGLGSRFLFARVIGLGTGGPLHRMGLSTEVAQAYERKTQECLDASMQRVKQQNVHEHPPLQLRANAGTYLDQIDHETRCNCVPGARWASVAEYGLGRVERVVRLAAAMHVMEYGVAGEISLETLQCSAALDKHYVESFARIVDEPPKPTQAEKDAAALEQEFTSLYLSTNCTQFLKSDIRTRALGLGLTPVRFTRALAVLGERGKVRTFPHLNKPWVEILCMPEFSRTPPYLRITQ